MYIKTTSQSNVVVCARIDEFSVLSSAICADCFALESLFSRARDVMVPVIGGLLVFCLIASLHLCLLVVHVCFPVCVCVVFAALRLRVCL